MWNMQRPTKRRSVVHEEFLMENYHVTQHLNKSWSCDIQTLGLKLIIYAKAHMSEIIVCILFWFYYTILFCENGDTFCSVKIKSIFTSHSISELLFSLETRKAIIKYNKFKVTSIYRTIMIL